MSNPETVGNTEPDPGVVVDGDEVVDPATGLAAEQVSGADAAVEAPGTAQAQHGDRSDLSVEVLIGDLERVTAERDQYLDTSRRVQAEFENYRKQVGKREADARERANETMVNEMLPVLDAFDGALSSGLEDLAPMQATLLDALSKQGLETINPDTAEDGTQSPFDPNHHEAVMHEAADDTGGPVVVEVLRVGYGWRGRVIRPAMVRVRG